MKLKKLFFAFFLIAVAVGLSSSDTFSQQASTTITSTNKRTTYRGASYAYKLTEQDFADTPAWRQENASEPPLSVGSAVRVARENLPRFVKSAEMWKLGAIMLQRFDADKWYYRIHFSCTGAALCRETEDRLFSMIVKMDGNIVEPKKVTTEP